MPANLEYSAVAIGLEKVTFHSNPKEGQCQRKFKLPLQLCSFHMLKRSRSNPIKWGLKSMNQELPDIQAGFRKGRGTRDQIVDICLIIEKASEFQENIYFRFIEYVKAFDCVDQNKLWKILKNLGIPDHLTCFCMQVRSNS